MHTVKRLAVIAGTIALTLTAGVAHAQSGHFVGTPDCTDIGLQVECDGKVAGLGGTTFAITVVADGVATVECVNPGGNRAPGQDTAITVAGSSGPLDTPRNGQYRFTVTTRSPNPLPPTPTCPNPQWTPVITDVAFDEATLVLTEDGAVSDQVVVPVG